MSNTKKCADCGEDASVGAGGSSPWYYCALCWLKKYAWKKGTKNV